MSNPLVPPLHGMGRPAFYIGSGVAWGLVLATWLAAPRWAPWAAAIVAPFFLLGVYDVLQRRHTILRNYPVIGHLRYLLESIRPEIQQYFIELNQEGRPISREQRSVVYARAKGQRSTQPFGTQLDVYRVGHEWLDHSLAPKEACDTPPRVRVGGPACTKPYDAALFNISAMSFGSLSSAAIRALNRGAARGGFFHNTGEGGISPYHREGGGDLCWQIGTAYFGCRTRDGAFDIEAFADQAAIPQVRMIEIKLSQGAKPGKGGILPASKITPEIARIRRVPLDGRDVLSPPAHTAFHTPVELMQFIQRLRERSGGKPVGIKLCLGSRREFIALCKAMRVTGIAPDFVTVDGAEGGTGAAPLEFSNWVGTPLLDALVVVQNALVGYDLRSQVRLFASGGITTAFGMVRRMALGADACLAARAFMLALGCIHALRCNMNDCPTGIATQDPWLVAGLDVPSKAERVARYQAETLHELCALVAAAGLDHPGELRPWHVHRRVGPQEIRDYATLYEWLEPGALLDETDLPERWRQAVIAASPVTFAPRVPPGRMARA